MIAWLVEPASFGFMQRAAVSTAAVGIAAPVLGCWLVSRRMVYLTDAMSHAILAGVAAAALAGASLIVGALGAALVMALLVALLTVRARVPEDSAIGVVGQGLFALGVIGVALQQEPRALSHVLFGNPLNVTWTEAGAQVLLASLVLMATWALAPLLTATTFDPLHARTVGIRVGAVETAMTVGMGLVVVLGLTTVGALMAVTLTVAPAVAARLLVTRMARMVPTAAALGMLAGVGGLLVSFYTGLPTGPVVAVIAVAEVAVAFGLSMGRNQVRRVLVARPGHHDVTESDHTVTAGSGR